MKQVKRHAVIALLLSVYVPLCSLATVAAAQAATLETASTDLTIDPSAPDCAVDMVGGASKTWRCDEKTYDPYADSQAKELQSDQCSAANGGSSGEACITAQNNARRVIIAFPAEYDVDGEDYDLVMSLHGTGHSDYSGQSAASAIDTYLRGWDASSGSVFQTNTVTATARSQAVHELTTFRQPIAASGRVIFASLSSGYNPHENNLRWDRFEPGDAGGSPVLPGDPTAGLPSDYLEDARRLLTFARQIKIDNPRIQRVYISGFSNGAEQVAQFVCFYPTAFDGFALFDRQLDAKLFGYCGLVGPGLTYGTNSQLYQDMTIDGTVSTGSFQVAPHSPSVAENRRPLFFAGGTHSHATNNDKGDLVAGVADVLSIDPATCLGNGTAADGDPVNCQNSVWEQTEQVVLDDSQNANNGASVAELATQLGLAGYPLGDTDLETGLLRFLDLWGLSGSYVPARDLQTAGITADGTPGAVCGGGSVFCLTYGYVPSICTGSRPGKTLYKTLVGGGARETIANSNAAIGAFVYKPVPFSFATGSSQVIARIETTGGAHYTQGRSHSCATAGTTHSVDYGTEFLRFLRAFGPAGSNI